MSMFRLLAAALLAAIVLPAPAGAAEKVNFGHIFTTDHPNHTWAVWAARQIERRTAGRYDVDVFPAAELGPEVDLVRKLDQGGVGIVYSGVTVMATVHGPISVSAAPYAFRDFDHWKAYAASSLFRELAAGYEGKTGHKVAGLAYYGERHLTTKTRVGGPEDMKGLRLRVPDTPLFRMYPQALGAVAVPVPFQQVYEVLRDGGADAQENPLPTILAMKFHEITPIINLTGHIIDSQALIVGKPLWAKLSAADRKIFAEVLNKAAAGVSDDIARLERDITMSLALAGATINRVDRTAFRNVFAEFYRGRDVPWSQEIYERLQALR